MKNLLLKNGSIVNEGEVFKGSIVIAGEYISQIIRLSDFKSVKEYGSFLKKVESQMESLDLTGLHIFPGVIDSHVHFREPGDGWKGNIESESRAAVLGGVTSFMDMPNNTPPATTRSLLEDKFASAEQSSYANYSFYLGASNSNIAEIRNIKRRDVCGVKLFMGSSTGNLLVDNSKAIDDIFRFCPTLIAVHCEDNQTIASNLKKAQDRAHILEGLIKALDHVDEVIRIIRESDTVEEAKSTLCSRFDLTEIQAAAIVEIRLRQLARMEKKKLEDELAELKALIDKINTILGDVNLQMGIIKDELEEVKKKFGDERKTEIRPDESEFNYEDIIADDDMVITISRMGYIKRTPLAEYRLQHRGGKGSKGSATRDEDFIEHIYVANMHSTMLFFTNTGKCFWLKVYQIPEGSKTNKGRAIQNVLSIAQGESVCAYLNVPTLKDEDYINNHYIVLATKKGIVKKTTLEAYSRPRANGVIAVNVREGDELLEAILTDGKSQIMLAAKEGKCVRFDESGVRAIGRTGTGVRGIEIEDGNEVVGMICVNAEDKEHTILVVSEHGYGKRSPLDDYRITSRGCKGVKTINITDKTGKLIGLKSVSDDNDLMIINRSGIVIRVDAASIKEAGRATQGVKLINIKDTDSIAAICVVPKSEDLKAAEAAENEEDTVNTDTQEQTN